jgi:HAD superfamily hydrolase (TIGR01509 family)
MPAASLPSAVLWDMDGTIVDTEPIWFQAQTALVERFGGTWTLDDAIAQVGMGLWDAARVLQDHRVTLTTDEIVSWQTDFVTERLVAPLPWRPGAVELLAALKAEGVPVALVTMSVRRMAEAVSAAVPSGPFDVVVAGDDVTRPKPDPEAYLTAAARLGVAPEACVAIEDSPPGLAAAVASGAATVGVPHQAVLPEGGRWRLWSTLAGRGPADLAAVAAALA